MRSVLPVLVGRPRSEALVRYSDGPDVTVEVYAATDGSGFAFLVRGPAALTCGAVLMGPLRGTKLYQSATEALAAGLDLPDVDAERRGPGAAAGKVDDETLFFPED